MELWHLHWHIPRDGDWDFRGCTFLRDSRATPKSWSSVGGVAGRGNGKVVARRGPAKDNPEQIPEPGASIEPWAGLSPPWLPVIVPAYPCDLVQKLQVLSLSFGLCHGMLLSYPSREDGVQISTEACSAVPGPSADVMPIWWCYLPSSLIQQERWFCAQPVYLSFSDAMLCIPVYCFFLSGWFKLSLMLILTLLICENVFCIILVSNCLLCSGYCS